MLVQARAGALYPNRSIPNPGNGGTCAHRHVCVTPAPSESEQRCHHPKSLPDCGRRAVFAARVVEDTERRPGPRYQRTIHPPERGRQRDAQADQPADSRRQDDLGKRRSRQRGMVAAVVGGGLEGRHQLRTAWQTRHHGPVMDKGLGPGRERSRRTSHLCRRCLQRRRHVRQRPRRLGTPVPGSLALSYRPPTCTSTPSAPWAINSRRSRPSSTRTWPQPAPTAFAGRKSDAASEPPAKEYEGAGNQPETVTKSRMSPRR